MGHSGNRAKFYKLLYSVILPFQTGILKTKGCHSNDDSLITCAWHKDSTKFVAGGTRGQFYQIVCLLTMVIA